MGKELIPHHLEGLRYSGLSDETIAALGFYRGTAAEVKTTPGFDAEAMEKESDRQYPSQKEGKA